MGGGGGTIHTGWGACGVVRSQAGSHGVTRWLRGVGGTGRSTSPRHPLLMLLESGASASTTVHADGLLAHLVPVGLRTRLSLGERWPSNHCHQWDKSSGSRWLGLLPQCPQALDPSDARWPVAWEHPLPLGSPSTNHRPDAVAVLSPGSPDAHSMRDRRPAGRKRGFREACTQAQPGPFGTFPHTATAVTGPTAATSPE